MRTERTAELTLTSIFPTPKGEAPQKSVRLPKEHWETIEGVAKERGLSLNDVVAHWVGWAIQQIDRIKAGNPGSEARWLLERMPPDLAQKLEAEMRKALKAGKIAQ